MDALVNFHFIRPWWLLALIPAGLLLVYIWRAQKTGQAWQKVIAPEFLTHLLEGTLNKQSRWPIGLLAFGWLLCVLALAGPAWNKLAQPVFKNQSATVIVWDLSYSMYATDSAPDRFTVAKHKLLDLLHARNDGLTALIVYSGDAHVVTPLTDDINTIENMVTSISPDIMPIPGSNAPDAVNMAIQLLKQANEPQGNIILISDGIDQDQTQKVIEAAKNARTPISVLGIGTIEGSAITLPNGELLKDNNGTIVTPTLTRSELQTVAKETNGIYVERQSDDSDTNALIAKSSARNNDPKKATDRFADVWQEEGAWLVLCLLPLAAWCFRRGWLLSLLFVVALYPTQNANASIFKTPDQKGQEAFNKKDYKKAAELFTNPEWKGSSYYLEGAYDKAAETFASIDTTRSNYNRGNALVESGKQKEATHPPSYQEAANAYEDAIEAYNRSIELDSTNKKAESNRAIAEKLLAEVKKKIEEQEKQQQQQQQNNNTDQTQQNDQQNNSEQQNQDAQQNSAEKQSTDQTNQENQQQNKDDAAQNSAQQSGSKGEERSQPQSEQQSSQATDASDKTSDEKNSAGKQSANEKPDNADTTQKEAGIAEDGDKEAADKSQPKTAAEKQRSAEEKQAMQQWLNKVPDDPAGLLERKFRYQSQQNNSSVDPNKTW